MSAIRNQNNPAGRNAGGALAANDQGPPTDAELDALVEQLNAEAAKQEARAGVRDWRRWRELLHSVQQAADARRLCRACLDPIGDAPPAAVASHLCNACHEDLPF